MTFLTDTNYQYISSRATSSLPLQLVRRRNCSAPMFVCRTGFEFMETQT